MVYILTFYAHETITKLLFHDFQPQSMSSNTKKYMKKNTCKVVHIFKIFVTNIPFIIIDYHQNNTNNFLFFHVFYVPKQYSMGLIIRLRPLIHLFNTYIKKISSTKLYTIGKSYPYTIVKYLSLTYLFDVKRYLFNQPKQFQQ